MHAVQSGSPDILTELSSACRGVGHEAMIRPRPRARSKANSKFDDTQSSLGFILMTSIISSPVWGGHGRTEHFTQKKRKRQEGVRDNIIPRDLILVTYLLQLGLTSFSA